NVELNLEFATLRASRDGFMSSSLVKPGALITAQQTLLATLYSSDPMWVTFSISEDRFLELQKTLKHPPGDRPDTAPPFHIRLADGTDYALTGKLNFIDATIDQKSGTLQVRVSVPNPDFIERPVFSTVIALVMILVGALAAVNLPIAQYPQVVPPQVTVTTSFPGANADVVSQSVAASIEQQVNGSQDMLYMSSKSGNDGSYGLTVTFDIGTDKNIDAIEVQNRVAIAQSQLPADVIRNGITVRKSTTDFLEVISLT